MYCPKCGKNVVGRLKYCNGCGGRLAGDDDKLDTPGQMLDGILETLFWFGILALGILVGLVAVLLTQNVRTDVVATIATAYLAVVFGVCFMLARQVPKLIDAKLRSWNAVADVKNSPQLAPPTTAQLEEFREPVMSVTDHTTKTLGKVPLKRH